MDEKRKPFVTISFRQPRFSGAFVAALLAVVVIAGAFGIQEFQLWQRKMLVTEARLYDAESALTEADARLNEAEARMTQTTSRLHEIEDAFDETTTRLQETEIRLNESEAKLQETEADLIEAKKQLEAYLPITPLNEPIAFTSDTWGINAFACIRMPQGYWTGWGPEDSIGRLLFYFAREWDSVEAIKETGLYTLVGGDDWSDSWDVETWSDSQFYYSHVAVQDSNPFTWSKSNYWYNNKDSWQGRLSDYCRETFQP
ncbi:MAG: hypothetical protein OXI34_13230 [Chloroflexota bacterium]|nr:hypothetical protein [Chloroflexota bacterium]MDE2948319.1 hypothetical protein [Chloroflexota bacterium]